MGKSDKVSYGKILFFACLSLIVSACGSGDASGPEAQIVRELGKFLLDGTLYQGYKPVLWSTVEKTALADAEVEYKDHTSNTVYVGFKVKTSKISLLKDAEIMRERIQTLDLMQNYIGEYYSKEWVMKNVLMFTDEDIEKMSQQASDEEPDEALQGDNDE